MKEIFCRKGLESLQIKKSTKYAQHRFYHNYSRITKAYFNIINKCMNVIFLLTYY